MSKLDPKTLRVISGRCRRKATETRAKEEATNDHDKKLDLYPQWKLLDSLADDFLHEAQAIEKKTEANAVKYGGKVKVRRED